ncbi:MAG: DMT family transporter, partial [Planctomycetota bacterium]
APLAAAPPDRPAGAPSPPLVSSEAANPSEPENSSRTTDAPAEPIGPSARTVRIGTALGLFSAVNYTLANAALRDVSRPDDFEWSLWVTLCKAFPVAVAAWALVGVRAWRGQPPLSSLRLWPKLMAVGVLAQLGGNLLFQEALGVLGLALTVPATFTGIILTGAGLGWLILGEPVRWRQGVSILLLIAATISLGMAAPDAAEAVISQALAGAEADPFAVMMAVTEALAAGCSYGLMGVVIRGNKAQGVGVAGTLAPLSLAGLLSLALFLLIRTGRLPLAETPSVAYLPLCLAGVANAVAFFSIAAALQRIPVVRSNLLNASQAAMAGVVGVVWFAEPPTGWLLAGIALTIAGLGLLGLRRRAG